MRKEFGKWIAEKVKEDKSVYVLDMDYGNVFDDLLKENPNNHIPCGVTEQAVIGVAAGMALEGLKPYVFAITPFLLERPFEQIKLDIVQQKANVTLVSYGDYPTAGPTHRALDVKKECEVLGIDLVEPDSVEDTKVKLEECYKLNKPVFFNMRKCK